jgi:hypothetical protein
MEVSNGDEWKTWAVAMALTTFLQWNAGESVSADVSYSRLMAIDDKSALLDIHGDSIKHYRQALQIFLKN